MKSLKFLMPIGIEWFGIVSTAMLVLSNLESVLSFADWLRWIVLKWQSIFVPYFSYLIGIFGLRVNAVATSMIAMAIFVSFVGVGSRLGVLLKGGEEKNHPVSVANILNWRVVFAVLLYFFQYIILSIFFIFPNGGDFIRSNIFLFQVFGAVTYCAAIMIGLRKWPLWASLVVAVSMLFTSYIFRSAANVTLSPTVSDTASFFIAAGFAVACGLTIVLIAPPIAFTKRILLTMALIITVVLMSWLSELNLPIKPDFS